MSLILNTINLIRPLKIDIIDHKINPYVYPKHWSNKHKAKNNR
jgi:hypothetical protein